MTKKTVVTYLPYSPNMNITIEIETPPPKAAPKHDLWKWDPVQPVEPNAMFLPYEFPVGITFKMGSDGELDRMDTWLEREQSMASLVKQLQKKHPGIIILSIDLAGIFCHPGDQ